ncbi:MAG: Uma2 family endonuclease [Ruminococcus sp.]|nr:Uma2 family endonuclease [Ruminococcus sp.]
MPFPIEHRYSAEEFFALDIPDNDRYELIEGELVLLAAPSEIHQELAGGIYAELRDFIRRSRGSCKPFIAPFDVKLDDDNVVQPDIMVICDPSKLDGKRCNGAPDIVIEVTSNDRTRDYSIKLELYRKSGVSEYWIVDPEKKRVVVYTFEDRKVDSMDIYTFDNDIPVGIYGGALRLNINALL